MSFSFLFFSLVFIIFSVTQLISIIDTRSIEMGVKCSHVWHITCLSIECIILFSSIIQFQWLNFVHFWKSIVNVRRKRTRVSTKITYGPEIVSIESNKGLQYLENKKCKFMQTKKNEKEMKLPWTICVCLMDKKEQKRKHYKSLRLN